MSPCLPLLFTFWPPPLRRYNGPPSWILMNSPPSRIFGNYLKPRRWPKGVRFAQWNFLVTRLRGRRFKPNLLRPFVILTLLAALLPRSGNKYADFSFVRACTSPSRCWREIYFQVKLLGLIWVCQAAYGATNATRQLCFELRPFLSAPN